MKDPTKPLAPTLVPSVPEPSVAGSPRGSALFGSLPEVEQEIIRLLDLRTDAARAYGASFENLWKIASASILGGKLVRPKLLMDTLATLRPGAPQTSTVQIAAAIEILHFAFLLHDDVIDGDLLRRGRPNLIGAVLQQRGASEEQECRATDAVLATYPQDLHWAQTSGILMGNLMLSLAHQVFARAEFPPETRLRLLDLLDHTITESVVGEQLDVGLSDKMIEARLDTVLDTSRLKTATYTFELPLRAATIISGSSPTLEESVGKVARHLGIAFQLQDDLLSTFGNPDEHGKDAFSDLREGKETAIIAYARMTGAWPNIEPWFGQRHLSPEKGLQIRELLTQCGAESFMRTLIEEQVVDCFDTIGSPNSMVPKDLARYFRHLVSSLQERRS